MHEIGFGTYPLKEDACQKAVEAALHSGYRVIDTATFYRNFAPIGKAIQCMDRSELYLISKAWPDCHHIEGLFADLKQTLKELKTSYLDAYLLHWPNHKVPIEESLAAMQKLQQEGLVRHIGVSNVTTNHMKRILECNVPISWVQVEMHPHFYDAKLVAFCLSNNIGFQAWAPFGRGRLGEDPLLQAIGNRYKKSANQVALRWILGHGCMPMPRSQNPLHIAENINVFDFALSKEEMDQINVVAANGKRERINPNGTLGFCDEFDFTYEECWPKGALV